jgi:hypothetical protein
VPPGVRQASLSKPFLKKGFGFQKTFSPVRKRMIRSFKKLRKFLKILKGLFIKSPLSGGQGQSPSFSKKYTRPHIAL